MNDVKFKVGDKLLCKKQLDSDAPIIRKGIKYKIISITGYDYYNDYVDFDYYILCDYGQFVFGYNQIYEYFHVDRFIRKKKLERLYERSES